jgi:hypothetical protein
VVEPASEPDAAAIAEGRDALARGEAKVRVQGNRVSAGRQQLRLGSDGLWYLFTKQFNDWMLSAPPSPDPAALLNP